MAAPRKYPDELRERATRMAVELRQDPATKNGAIQRVAEQLGMHPETLRNWVRQAEIDGGVRPGTTTGDAQRLAELEREVRERFPADRVARLDRDVVERKGAAERIIDAFAAGELGILVGTSLVAKGLDVPEVTLVGIVSADVALTLPDERAAERTYQLLAQAVGRAGRGDVEGEVFVQAFTPFHPAIQYARRHDFVGFYEQEIEFREQLKYPPASRVALLTLKGRNEEKVKFSAEHVRRGIESKVQSPKSEAATAAGTSDVGLPTADLIIAGPAPAPLLRADGFYRYQLMLRTRAMSRLSLALAQITTTLALPEDVTLTVDVDPVGLS